MSKKISYCKKTLVLLMAFMMIFTMMPSMAFADSDTSTADSGMQAAVQSQGMSGNANAEAMPLSLEEGGQQAAQTSTFKGTAEHGYINEISFGTERTIKNNALQTAMNYVFDSSQTEYSLTMPDCEIGYIQWTRTDNSGMICKMNVAYYDEGSKEFKDLETAMDANLGSNGCILADEVITYEKPTVIRLAIGPTVEVEEGAGASKVDLTQADIYYFSIVRQPSLQLLTVIDESGVNYPMSPVFNKFEGDTYYIYGDFVDDTEIKLSLGTGISKVTRKNDVYVNGTIVKENESASTSATFNAKYLELYQDVDGTKYIKIDLTRPKESGEGEIVGKSYKIYFVNEQKVKFTKQPQGGTFEPENGKNHVLSVEVDVPEGAEVSYKWVGSKFTTKWSLFNQAFADRNTRTTANLNVPLKSAGKFRFYCQVTVIIDGETFVANSDIVNVNIVSNGKISAPGINDGNTVLTTRTYYQYENAVQLTASFSPVDAGVTTNMQWYVSENADGSDAVKLETEPIRGTSSSGINGAVTPKTDKVGTFYYYCIGTCTLTEGTETYTASSKTDIVKIEVKEISVDLQGDGSENNPYIINSYADMEKLRDAVNNDGITFANRYIKITAKEITLPADWEGLGSEDESMMDKYVSWLKPFSGNLDGGNNLIKMEKGCRGFIRYARDAFVKDLNLYGEEITVSALLTDYVVDYGLDRQYATGCPSPITAENVTLKSGSRTKYSGLIGIGSGSGANDLNLRNCTVEEGVTVGYDRDVQSIGSLAGGFNGTIINCRSAADVYGASVVGGLAGHKGQSMGLCMVLNSSFTGSITATGVKVGGIMACGYESESAPNSPVVTITNCYVDADITGSDYIGGIYGSEGGVLECWENGSGGISNNSFYGTITATKADAEYVGGTVGFLRSFNKHQGMEANYYLDTCGASKGIGKVWNIRTSGPNAIPEGFDIHSTCIGASDAAFKDGTVLNGLQNGERSYKNWVQGGNYPVHSDEPVLYAIELGGKYKTDYVTGDTFSAEGMVITGKLSDGSTKNISLDDNKLKFTGFNKHKRGVQTITVTYGVASATYDITVLYNESQVREIYVYFTLLGDEKHGDPTEATGTHTLKEENLQTWIPQTKFTITNNTTVKDVFERALTQNGMTWTNTTGNYVSAITRNGVALAEFTNGKLSGWMYTLNGTHPLLGVQEQYLDSGDVIVFHYTDDYTVEEGSDKWGSAGAPMESVSSVTTDKSFGTTIAPTDVKVTEKNNADGTKESVATVTVSADNQKEILKQAKSSKSKEIILQVSKDAVKDATKADVQLEKSFIESIVKDTDAKLTVKTPFGDKTYTQDELKALAAAATGKTVSLEIVKSEKTDEELKAEQLEAAVTAVSKASMKARSTKTSKGSVKIVFKPDTKTQNFIDEMKDMGYTVKYRFYRSTKKSSGYKAMLTKASKTYTNTSGKKGTKYYYKVQVRVYDENGKCVAKTALKQCKYACRTWSK